MGPVSTLFNVAHTFSLQPPSLVFARSIRHNHLSGDTDPIRLALSHSAARVLTYSRPAPNSIS